MNEIIYVDNFEPPATIHRGRAKTIAKDGSGGVEVNGYPTYCVRWSPLGDKLALTTETGGNVSVTAVDGSSAVTINPGAPTHGSYLPGGDFSPDQSAFALLLSAAGGNPNGILIFPTDLSASTLITLGTTGDEVTGGSGSGQSLLWLPDGRFAYLSINPTSGQQEVRVCNHDGSGITTVLSGNEDSGNAWWGLCDKFSDGSLLVMFTPQDDPKGQLIRCNPDGSGRTVLYDDPAGALIGQFGETGAAISPDQSQIAMLCRDPVSPAVNPGSIRVMPAGGGALVSIAADAWAFGGAGIGWDRPLVTTVAAGAQDSGIIALGR